MAEPALDPIGEGTLLAGKYLLEKRLGVGGMGEVYRAQNTLIGRAVAIKVLRAEHAQNVEITTRFLREARAANMVRHPNVVDVHDIGQDERGTPFIVQELLLGEDLAHRVTELGGRVPLENTLRVLLPVIDAVAFGHSKGVVHRDLKPENVFLARVDGKIIPKLLDYGISHIAGKPGDTRITATGVAMGTPAYMSPEQVLGHQVDARTDVWAIGIIIHEMLTGALPFPADSQSALFVQICTAPEVPICEAAPDAPAELGPIIARCLKKSREERYADAAELGQDLRKVWAILAAAKADPPSLGMRVAQPAPVDPEAAQKKASRQAAETAQHVVHDVVPELALPPRSLPRVPVAAADVPDLEMRAPSRGAIVAAPPASSGRLGVKPNVAAPVAPQYGFDDDNEVEGISGLKLADESNQLHSMGSVGALRGPRSARGGIRSSVPPPAEGFGIKGFAVGIGLLFAIALGIAGIRVLLEQIGVSAKIGPTLAELKLDTGVLVTAGVVLTLLGLIAVPKTYRSLRESPASGLALSLVIAVLLFAGAELVVHAFD